MSICGSGSGEASGQEGKMPVPDCPATRMAGSWSLECELPEGHETKGTWHRAHVSDRREITGPRMRHVTESTETIEWEPGELRRALATLSAEQAK